MGYTYNFYPIKEDIIKYQNNQDSVTSFLKTILLSLFFISGLVFYGTAGANQNTADKSANIAINYNIPFFGLVGVNEWNKTGQTLLHIAVKLNKIKKIKRLIEEGADPNIADKQGNTPLLDAVKYKTLEMVNILINAGADPNTADKQGNTALHYAASRVVFRDDMMINILIKAGANLHALNAFGNTPIRRAVKRRVPVDTLLKAGANPNAVDKIGQALIHDAALYSDGNPKIVDTLLKAGANPNAVTADFFKRPALYFAVLWNYPEVAITLLKAGANPNVVVGIYNRTTTLFDEVVRVNEDIKIVSRLLGLQEQEEATLLLKQELEKSEKVIAAFKKAGANPSAVIADPFKISSIDEAIQANIQANEAIRTVVILGVFEGEEATLWFKQELEKSEKVIDEIIREANHKNLIKKLQNATIRQDIQQKNLMKKLQEFEKSLKAIAARIIEVKQKNLIKK